MSFLFLSFVFPLAHRFRRSVLLTTIFGLLLATFVMMLTFAFGRTPFDPMHQKRVFAIHFEDVSVAFCSDFLRRLIAADVVSLTMIGT